MEPLPEITTSHDGVVVEDLNYRVPWFGLFGEPFWVITWRSVADPDLQSVSRLACDDQDGEAAVDGEAFVFTVRWRRDLRRRRCAVPVDDPIVTPGGILDLAREN